MDLYGDVHVKVGYPVKAGESILGGAPLIADSNGYVTNYALGGVFVGHAVLPVNNSNGGNGDKTVAVAIDGLVVGDVADIIIGGPVNIGDASIHLDDNINPVIDDTNPRIIGQVVSFLGGQRVVWRITFAFA